MNVAARSSTPMPETETARGFVLQRDDRVRQAYFSGAPDEGILEAIRTRLPSHWDATLPPVCATSFGQGGHRP